MSNPSLDADTPAETEPAASPPPRPAQEIIPAFAPVPREKDRCNGWKPAVQLAFIEALAETGSVKSACRRVGRAEVGAYLLRRHPDAEQFRRAWDAALDIGMRRIEDVAMDRALHGHQQPVYSYGKLVGERTVYNDRLLMFMLRNRAPDRFGGALNKAGGAAGANAVDKLELARLKKRWRQEWERDRPDNQPAEIRRVQDSIDAKLDTMRRNWLDNMNPRARALYAQFEAALDEDEAEREAPAPDEALPLLPGVFWPEYSRCAGEMDGAEMGAGEMDGAEGDEAEDAEAEAEAEA